MDHFPHCASFIPLLLLSSFICASSHFLLKFRICISPSPFLLLPLSFSIVLSTSSSHFSFHHVSPFPFPSTLFSHVFSPFLSGFVILCQLPPLILFMAVILWASPAVLLMLPVEHINTSNFGSFKCAWPWHAATHSRYLMLPARWCTRK